MEQTYTLEARSTEEWAREQASDLDNAFGNLLRGSKLDGYTLVLLENGEVEDSQNYDKDRDIEEAADDFLEQQGLELDELGEVDLGY